MNCRYAMFLSCLLCLPSTVCRGGEGFVPLFDGATLAGWKSLPGGRWEVADGAIVGTQQPTEKRHGQLISVRQFSNFVVRLKFKAVEGNSGLYFRVQRVDHPVAVKGFQAEIDAAGNDVSGLYETLGRAWVSRPTPEAVRQCFRAGQWNEMTVTAVEGSITVEVNGVKTAELTDDPGARRGHLALQLHGGQKMLVLFKDIEIRELAAAEPLP